MSKKLVGMLAMIAAVSVFGTAAVVGETVLFEDDFEDYDVGVSQSGMAAWHRPAGSGAGGSVTVRDDETDTPSAQTYSERTIAAETADVWLLPLNGGAVVYAGSVAGTNDRSSNGYRLGIALFSADVRKIYTAIP